MEKLKYKEFERVNELTERVIEVCKELETDLTPQEAIVRYDKFLLKLKQEATKDENKETTGKYFVFAIQDYIMCCSIYRYFEGLGTSLVNYCIESAERINLNEFCAGVIAYINACIDIGELVFTKDIRFVSSLEDIKKELEDKIDENNIRYN